ncbi:hypothetical protein KVMX100_120209 [Klebsiella variicola]|nr:hypothetical protein KVMX100_120209 [Klebsiella variicola]
MMSFSERLEGGAGVKVLLAFEVADQHPALGHKLRAVTHQANILQLRINGIAQFAGRMLIEHHHRDPLQARFVFQQYRRQRAHQLVRRRRHALEDSGHIRQAVVRQMRQRSSPTVEDALHVIEHRQDDLIRFADSIQVNPAGEIAVQDVIQGGTRHFHFSLSGCSVS